MSEVTTYRCDVCGKLKQEANHWMRAVLIVLESYRMPVFTITGWDGVFPDGANQLHLCGMECAQKAMAKAMQEGK